MNNRDWFANYEREARRNGDVERASLGQYQREAYRYREKDPDHALDLLARGRRLAERLGEPWWVLFYDQYRVHALLHFKQDFRDVLELAVRNTLELRKGPCKDYPHRFGIHGDLVSAYLGIDPVGHAGAIQQALVYLDRELPTDGDDRYLWLGRSRQFALELGDLDTATRLAYQTLALAAEDPDAERASHFLVFAYSALAEIAFHRGDNDLLVEAALVGAELAERVGHQIELAGFWLWQALVSRRRGQYQQGRNLLDRGVARMARLAMPPDSSYRDAECAFHLEGNDVAAALAVRDIELAQIANRGRFADECLCLLARGQLLTRLGLWTTAEADKIRVASSKLRQPQEMLERLKLLER